MSRGSNELETLIKSILLAAVTLIVVFAIVSWLFAHPWGFAAIVILVIGAALTAGAYILLTD